MKPIVIITWLLLCKSAFAWNPIQPIDPSNTNDLHQAGLDITYSKWRHVDYPTTRYWFTIKIDISSLPESTRMEAMATLRLDDDINDWDVKIIGTRAGKDAHYVQLVFEAADKFIPNSVIKFQKREGEAYVGGYEINLRDIIAVPELNSMNKKKGGQPGHGPDGVRQLI